jgi:hypothetical protein
MACRVDAVGVLRAPGEQFLHSPQRVGIQFGQLRRIPDAYYEMSDHLALTQCLRCLGDDPTSSDEFFVLPSRLLPPSLFCASSSCQRCRSAFAFLIASTSGSIPATTSPRDSSIFFFLFPFSFGPCVAYGSCFITEQRDPQESRRLVVALRRRPAPIPFSPRFSSESL